MNLFLEISSILALVALVSLFLTKLRLPLLLGYLVVGILIGPAGFNLIKSHEAIENLAHFGVVMLLFIIGIHLSPKILKEIGNKAVRLGVWQVGLTTILATLVLKMLDFGLTESLLMAVALSFSSTILVLKLLADRNELDALHGRLSVGLLLVQDIMVTILLIFLSGSFAGGITAGNLLPAIFKLLFVGGSTALVIILITHLLLPKILKSLAQNQESLFVFSLAFGLIFATIFEKLGFSLEIGALAAGVALASSEYAEEISARLKPLRDFFLIIFFVSLGSSVALQQIYQLLIPALIATIFVIVIKPLLIIAITRRLKIHRIPSFKVGVSMSQISEFSLILGAIWYQAGLISSQGLTTITLVGILSIMISTFIISHLDQFQALCKPLIERIPISPTNKAPNVHQPQVLLLGYNRVGEIFVKSFKLAGFKFLVIDYDPEQIELLKKKRLPHLYGDIADVELLDTVNFDSLELVISNLKDLSVNLTAIKHLIGRKTGLNIISFAQTKEESASLTQAGATKIILPYQQSAKKLANLIEKNGLNLRQ